MEKPTDGEALFLELLLFLLLGRSRPRCGYWWQYSILQRLLMLPSYSMKHTTQRSDRERLHFYHHTTKTRIVWHWYLL